MSDDRVAPALAALADAGLTLRDVADGYIATVVARCGGDRPAATKRLGVSLKTIYNRLNERQSFVEAGMLFAITVTAPGRPTLYVASTGGLVADAAFARKFSVAPDAEGWRVDWVARRGRGGKVRDWPGARSHSAVVEVCSGGQFDRGSVVLDRAKKLDFGASPTNGAVGKHVEKRT